MRHQDSQTGIITTLTSVSSVACGALLCLALWISANSSACAFSAWIYFYAYVAGSVGFLLTAPVNLLLPIIRKYPDNVLKSASVWAITTLAIFLPACAVGMIVMLICNRVSPDSEPSYMASQFISGAFLLFASGGIHWLAYRRRHKTF